jgi:DNA phosphorothioation-dependent restriction protein DptH
MSVSKVSESTVREILRLHKANTDPARIAQMLDLKKIQVSAIIAHDTLKVTSHYDLDSPVSSLSNCKSDIIGAQREPAVPARSIAIECEEDHPRLDPETIADNAEEGILVGKDREFGDLLYWNPENPTAVQNPHLMIVGESGSGKTYTVQCLTAELAQRNIPSIIFDYGQGFELHTLDDAFRNSTKPKEYLLGEEGISLNPLRIFPGDAHGPKSVASRLSDVFDAVYNLGPIQRKVLIDAILSAFEKSGITADDRTTWGKQPPSITKLQETLEYLSADKEYPNARNAVGLAARLTTFFMLSSFRADDNGWSWDRLIADPDHRVHVLQFRGIEGKTQRVLVEVLLWHLFFYLKSQGQRKLRVYCVLDEAHHLSFRDSGPIDQLLREARKFGVGLIFASQQPEDFSQAAFSNSASKLVFQTADPTLKVSRFLAAKCANYDSPEQIHDSIALLPQGDALFITKNRGHLVQILDLRKRATLWRQH